MMPGSSGVAVNSVNVHTAVPLEQLTWGSPVVVEGLRLVILPCVPSKEGSVFAKRVPKLA